MTEEEYLQEYWEISNHDGVKEGCCCVNISWQMQCFWQFSIQAAKKESFTKRVEDLFGFWWREDILTCFVL